MRARLVVLVCLAVFAGTVVTPGPASALDLVVDPEDFYFSIAAGDTVARLGGGEVAIRNEDVAFFDASEDAFELVFDGSDVGLESAVLDAVATPTDDPMHGLILSFTSARSVPEIPGMVDDSDLVLFTPTSLGEKSTAGTFTLYLDGSDIGLTDDGEDIDAVEVQDDFILISTVGNYSVTGTGGSASGQDEDLLECVPTGPGNNCPFPTTLDFTGSGLAASSEDVDAFALDGERAYFSTVGSYSVPGDSGPNEDVFRCQFDAPSECFGRSASFEKFFAGDDHTVAGDITALDVPGVPGE